MDQVSLYQAVGGTKSCRNLAEAFYERVARDPILRPLFPGKTFRCAIEEFTAFLVQFLGGPPEDTQRRWWLSLRESHLRFQIGARERAAWMKNMIAALDDAPMEEPARSALRSLFEQASGYVVNAGPTAAVTGDGSETKDVLHQEMCQRWEAQMTLDRAVAAVRSGAADRAIALSEGSILRTHLTDNRAVFAALLAQMIGSGDPILLAYVRQKISADPALAHERYSGRTLLHGAAAAGNLTIVKLLLHLGADPNVTDDGGHTPLYCLANQCKSGGGDVVRAFIQAGANVDARDGVKHCTALHMAARRGSVAIAEALLDCGAAIDVKDSLGDTPLRRAVNCGKIDVARLLLSRGADIRSKGNKGLTPLSAARTQPMRRLLELYLR